MVNLGSLNCHLHVDSSLYQFGKAEYPLCPRHKGRPHSHDSPTYFPRFYSEVPGVIQWHSGHCFGRGKTILHKLIYTVHFVLVESGCCQDVLRYVAEILCKLLLEM